jgi:hypothetical protein
VRALTQKDEAKLFLVAISIDFVYQIIELRRFYSEEAIVVATLLAELLSNVVDRRACSGGFPRLIIS